LVRGKLNIKLNNATNKLFKLETTSYSITGTANTVGADGLVGGRVHTAVAFFRATYAAQVVTDIANSALEHHRWLSAVFAGTLSVQASSVTNRAVFRQNVPTGFTLELGALVTLQTRTGGYADLPVAY
jgi:hypothetical protein